jgi:hypothetical protein
MIPIDSKRDYTADKYSSSLSQKNSMNFERNVGDISLTNHKCFDSPATNDCSHTTDKLISLNEFYTEFFTLFNSSSLSTFGTAIGVLDSMEKKGVCL